MQALARVNRWLVCTVIVAIACVSTVTAAGAPAVTIRLALKQIRVVAGTPIKGTALFINTTTEPIPIQACARLGWFEVGLTNGLIAFDPAFASPACLPSAQLAPGLNRFPFTVLTTYLSCVQPGGRSSLKIPTCAPTRPPPLPAGTYTTRMVTAGSLPPATPPPQPISVTLLPASR